MDGKEIGWESVGNDFCVLRQGQVNSSEAHDDDYNDDDDNNNNDKKHSFITETPLQS